MLHDHIDRMIYKHQTMFNVRYIILQF